MALLLVLEGASMLFKGVTQWVATLHFGESSFFSWRISNNKAATGRLEGEYPASAVKS